MNIDLIGYAPNCDTQGFYKITQCHQTIGVCWCVDKHGVEFGELSCLRKGEEIACFFFINNMLANTRTRDKPNCGKFF